MNLVRLASLSAFAAIAATAAFADPPAKVAATAAKPTVVLVHGAFADGSGWAKVIPLLEKEGFPVIAVQNPLTSLADDVATTRRVIDAQKGPVVVVGHSYGGAVVTGAAAGAGNVRALVYVAAFAPDGGEPVGAFQEKYPSPALRSLVVDAAGFATIDRARFHEVFCADVTDLEARVMGAAQKPVSAASFGQSVPAAAWRSAPSWYLVAQQDKAIDPELQRFYAKRMGAKASEVKASHLPYVSQPKVVAALIAQAAQATQATTKTPAAE